SLDQNAICQVGAPRRSVNEPGDGDRPDARGSRQSTKKRPTTAVAAPTTSVAARATFVSVCELSPSLRACMQAASPPIPFWQPASKKSSCVPLVSSAKYVVIAPSTPVAAAPAQNSSGGAERPGPAARSGASSETGTSTVSSAG